MTEANAPSEWTPTYARSARANAARADQEAGEFRDVDLSQLAVAAAVRELAAEVRALRHQLCGPTPPRAGALKDIERSIDLTTRP